MRLRRMPPLLFTAITSILIAGCLGPDRSPGSRADSPTAAQHPHPTFDPVTGSLNATIDAVMDEVYNASMEAAAQLQLKPIADLRDERGFTLKTRDPSGETLSLSGVRVSTARTDLRVSCGPLGSESKARIVLHRVLSTLR